MFIFLSFNENNVPLLCEVRILCSKYLNHRYGEMFEIIDETMPDTKIIVEMSHFSFEQNPSITVTISNFPLVFPDGKC